MTSPEKLGWSYIRQRLHKKNSSGVYDTVHLETSADLIVGAVPVAHGGTGATSAAAARTNLGITLGNLGAAASSHTHTIAQITSLQNTLNGKAPASHTHSASQITSGTLGVARGGTGVTSNPSMLVNLSSTAAASVFAASPRPGVTGTLPVTRGGTGRTTLTSGYFLRGNGTGQITMSSVEDVKNELGVTSASKPSTTINVGTNVSMANFDWICVHQDTNYQYLMTRYVIGTSVFGIHEYGQQFYTGSIVALTCMLFGCAIGVWGNDDVFGNITLNGVSGYCHLATSEQMNGGFSYFNSDSRRIAYDLAGTVYTYWTADAWFVLTDGRIFSGGPYRARGFRPFVALKR